MHLVVKYVKHSECGIDDVRNFQYKVFQKISPLFSFVFAGIIEFELWTFVRNSCQIELQVKNCQFSWRLKYLSMRIVSKKFNFQKENFIRQRLKRKIIISLKHLVFTHRKCVEV